MVKLRFGFSTDVISQNVQSLIADGKTSSEAEKIAAAYADQCKSQTQIIQDDRKRSRR